ncbi:MAG TPA: hypothetical protein VE197_10960, partial [Mycobacterium sp.]|nr:hypothetical protein [Mycobacterium sp.]
MTLSFLAVVDTKTLVDQPQRPWSTSPQWQAIPDAFFKKRPTSLAAERRALVTSTPRIAYLEE